MSDNLSTAWLSYRGAIGFDGRYLLTMADLEAAFRAGAAVSQWQPIETAPKDGDILVCWRVGTDMLVVEWEESGYGGVSPGWSTLDGLCYHPEAFGHWMPLPSPPAKEPQP